MRIALFITRVTDTLLPKAGQATARVLERLGHTVVFPEEQTCCGQIHGNSGYEHEALALVRRFVQRLLGNVRAIDLVEPGEAESCCGFGGTFAVPSRTPTLRRRC